MSFFYVAPINVVGKDALKNSLSLIKGYGFKKCLLVTDAVLNKIGLVKVVQDALKTVDIVSEVYDAVVPNPTDVNVQDGFNIIKSANCDFVVSLGGGSAHDCAKGIALLTTNGGKIGDYEGVDKSGKPQMPLVCINTTSGTAAEVTRFAVITDTSRKVKMVIVDKHITPVLSINDTEFLKGQPPSLTAATGMDALTHAVEAYVSTGATPMTDCLALGAIDMIKDSLKKAYDQGGDLEAREQMGYAQLMAGLAFNNASLGYVHAMAHQLGGLLDLPHGLCNAILLPRVQTFNTKTSAARLKVIASHLGCKVDGLSDEDGAKKGIEAITALGKSVGIVNGFSDLKVTITEDNFKTMAENALKDACAATNPRKASIEEIIQIFKASM